VRSAADAVTYGLVDGAKYRDEVLAILKEKMGLDAGKDIEFAELSKYTRATPADKAESKGGKEKIAVVYAQGSIGSGESEDDMIGSTTVSEAIRDAREDSTVKAIVLRVNSPGGSGLASDVIWREVDLARKTKPVVVSMGDLAASGGYYISCAASKIYAEPTTITGSIGVFGIIPNMQGFFNNKLGITFDGDKTNHYADMFDVSRPMREDERRIIQSYVDHFYETFKQRVADGRKLDVARVDSIGRGRVWTGVDAKELGLVDELGGLEDAVKGAAALASLTDYRTVDYPEQKGFFEQLMADLNGQARTWVAEQTFGDDAALMKQFEKVREARRSIGVQARMPFDIEIH
jgi:protease-4